MSGSGRKADAECRKHSDLLQEIADLNQEVRMISDSLVACKQISNYRPAKKEFNFAIKTNVRPKTIKQTPLEILLPPDERTLEYLSCGKTKSIIVSYMLKEQTDLRYLRKSKTFVSREEILSKNDAEDEAGGFGFFEDSRSWSWDESRDFVDGTSKIALYRHEDVDSVKVIEIIQRELKILMEKVPNVALIVSNLSDALFHYKNCFRCNQKIRPFLPWILNRIQKLIKYVTVKKHGVYLWPNDFSYLRLPKDKKSEEINKESSSTVLEEVEKVEEEVKLIGKAEKVNAFAVSDDTPGIQILLEVKPEKKKKRFFEQARIKEVYRSPTPYFVTFLLKEPPSLSVVYELRPKPTPRVVWSRKQEVVCLKEFKLVLPLLFLKPQPVTPGSCLVLTCVASAVTVQTAKPELFLKPVEPCEVQTLQANRNSLTVLIQQSAIVVGVEETPENLPPQRPNDTVRIASREFLTNNPELVRDLLKEAEEEKMHVQKVRELEEEVKGLKDLMLEVHKNQMELSKVLLEKGVYSQPMIRLTDPKMLEEESQAVSRAEELEVPGRRSSSLEALQLTVDDLKRKCAVKNRMIVTLLKGLRSNVPKEWWEEVVDYIFDESKPIEEFDPDKVTEFVRQTSMFLTDGEKASPLSPSLKPCDVQPSEEEMAKMRGHEGEKKKRNKEEMQKVEDDLRYLLLYDEASKWRTATPRTDWDDFLTDDSPLTVVAFPATSVPITDAGTESLLKKLENQIVFLNAENDRLWRQVKELRELLQNSVREANKRKLSSESDKTSEVIKQSGRMINLTIQIGDKDGRHSKDTRVLKISKLEDNDDKGGVSSVEDITDKTFSVPYNSDGRVTLKLVTSGREGLRLKSERRRSENDLNYVDETVSDYIREVPKDEKLRNYLQSEEGSFGTPYPSGHDVFFKTSEAGPSRSRQIDVGYLLQKPSVMELVANRSPGMFATMANERELQTIPENDHADCSPSSSTSQGVTQAIQRLRTRVRSIHKDVTVLKSKNDKIDKLLERLTDDALENSQSFEKIENDINSLKDSLG